jgi:tetratricopeptide (TPR) repeat protein
MDLLDFEAKDLYFDRADSEEVQALIKSAAELYSQGDAELVLLKAYLRAPESLNVLVALNRFYYYQHRLPEALLMSEKALILIRRKLAFPDDWRELQQQDISNAPKDLLTQIRLYLFTLKSIGFLNMRMENLELSKQIFEKVVALDEKDRIGAQGLLDLVLQRLDSVVKVDFAGYRAELGG